MSFPNPPQHQASAGFGSAMMRLGGRNCGGAFEEGTPGAMGIRSNGSAQNLEILEAPFCARHSPQAGDGQV